jgi:predicted MFS family arabinose efflux permease
MLWLLGFMVALENLGASCGVTWTAQLLREEYGINDAQAGAVLSAMALGVFLGRLLLGTFVSSKFSDWSVLGACYAGAVITYSTLLLVSNYFLCLALFFVWGALVAAQAPTMYAIASAKFGSRAATAISLMDAIGSLGSFMGPTLLGKLADRSNLHFALWLVPAIGTIFVMIVCCWKLFDRFCTSSARSSAL